MTRNLISVAETIGKLRKLAECGASYKQAADILKIKIGTVSRHAVDYDIPLIRGRQGPKDNRGGPTERTERMAALYKGGATLQEIGSEFGITRERVRQLITVHHGLRRADGGESFRSREALKEFQTKRDARLVRRFGCTYKQYTALLKHAGKPTRAFTMQRSNAKSRDIGWELNLWQWWSIWRQSGKWASRGRGRGHCMCRLNDVGPYSVDNVYIATGTENMQDHWVIRRAAELEVAA